MNGHKPVVTVITVVYNGASTILQAIGSVLAQTYDRIDYVIVDGASTDGTVEIIKNQSSRLGSWISEPDKGVYDAMNKGVRMAKGDWIYFLGADDVLASPSVIADVVNSINKQNEVIYGDVIFSSSQRRYDGPFNSFKIVTRNISHQALFYPRSVFQAMVFDTHYRVFADYHLNLTLFRDRRWTFRYIPLVIAIFNDGGISGSNAVDEEFRRDWMSIIENNFPWTHVMYRKVRTALARMLKRSR